MCICFNRRNTLTYHFGFLFIYRYTHGLFYFFLSFGKWSLTVFHLDRISKAIFLFSFICSFVRSFIFSIRFELQFSGELLPGQMKNRAHGKLVQRVCVYVGVCSMSPQRKPMLWYLNSIHLCMGVWARIWFELLKKQFHWWLVLNPLTNWVLGYFFLIHSFQPTMMMRSGKKERTSVKNNLLFHF